MPQFLQLFNSYRCIVKEYMLHCRCLLLSGVSKVGTGRAQAQPIISSAHVTKADDIL